MSYKMSYHEEMIYKTVYSNAVLYIRRAIKEITSSQNNLDDVFDNETGIISSLFCQMSIELSLKAFLIKETGIKTVIEQRDANKHDSEIWNLFNNNNLHTKSYNDLKGVIIKRKDLIWFQDVHKNYLNKFQTNRNRLVHLNLFLNSRDLSDLKSETIFVIVHILVPLLTDINFDFESPTEFYEKHLTIDDFNKLISYKPYYEEMEKLALYPTGKAYNCPECYKRAYSTENDLCYCCNLNYSDAVEYAICNNCNEEAVIFDPLNISLNNHRGNGLCLKCENKMEVYKCPECTSSYTFYSINELVRCSPNRCHLSS